MTDQDTSPAPSRPRPPGARKAAKQPWLRRDHPTFSALAGFYTGMVFIIVVPAVYAGILATVVDQETAEELFPYVLVALAVPLVLLVPPVTRRFGRYMLIGVLSTMLVVGAVAGTMLYLLVF